MYIPFEEKFAYYSPPRTQLLKWVGSKQKFAGEISKFFPVEMNRYIEPFLGSGALIGTVSPENGIGSDIFKPLIEIWMTLKEDPKQLTQWYADRRNRIEREDRVEVYKDVLSQYNSNPNGADFLFLTRACYGGIVRFRKNDGYMSTPCGVHIPIPVKAFQERVAEWRNRIKNVNFIHADYKDVFKMAQPGDFIYCDPPYSHSQAILYGAQQFKLHELLNCIKDVKDRGVNVALSIDGSKKSGNLICDLPVPDGLFAEEIFIHLGRSMLKRFQMEGQTLESEVVADRLLLTYSTK